MTAQTGMTPKQKLKILRKLDALEGSMYDLIHRDLRSIAECQALIEALQSFKDGRLLGLQTKQSKGTTQNQPVDYFYDRLDYAEMCVLELSTDTRQRLIELGITQIGELVQFTEAELRTDRRISKKNLQEVKEELNRYGLSLGMNLGRHAQDFPKPQHPHQFRPRSS